MKKGRLTVIREVFQIREPINGGVPREGKNIYKAFLILTPKGTAHMHEPYEDRISLGRGEQLLFGEGKEGRTCGFTSPLRPPLCTCSVVREKTGGSSKVGVLIPRMPAIPERGLCEKVFYQTPFSHV